MPAYAGNDPARVGGHPGRRPTRSDFNRAITDDALAAGPLTLAPPSNLTGFSAGGPLSPPSLVPVGLIDLSTQLAQITGTVTTDPDNPAEPTPAPLGDSAPAEVAPTPEPMLEPTPEPTATTPPAPAPPESLESGERGESLYLPLIFKNVVPSQTLPAGPSLNGIGRGSNEELYLNPSADLVLNGVTYQAVDIVRYNRTTDSWSLYFDGSDLGLDPAQSQINGMGVITSAGSEFVYLSFSSGFNLSGLGSIDDSDIVRFVPASLGDNTSGSFEWVLDGSDVGLETNGEDIVALGLASDGDLLVSVKNDGGFDAGGVTGDDEDIFRFTPDAAHTGQASSGSWSLYFDGSMAGLDATDEDVVGFWEGADGTLYLSTIGNYDVGALSAGRGGMCWPVNRPSPTASSPAVTLGVPLTGQAQPAPTGPTKSRV